MKPVCVPCQRFYRPTKNGRFFIEGMPVGGTFDHPVPAGIAGEGSWVPYKLWIGDEWGCPDCGAKIIVGVPSEPISEHYKPGFKDIVNRLGPELQVNDC